GQLLEPLGLLAPQNLDPNYGKLDWDRRHILSISHLWEIPFGRNSSNALTHALIGGWQVNGILSWQSGAPLTVFSDPITCNCPGSVALASLNGTASPYLTSSQPFFLNPAAFSSTPATLTGNLNRAVLSTPSATNYNLSLFKTFRVWERANL